MRRHIMIFGGTLAFGAALCATAGAQEHNESYLAQHVRAPSDALELKLGTGYTQGFGTIAPGRGLGDVAGSGIGVSADVDYRVAPTWSFGVEGQYQEFTSEQNSSARGAALNLGATYHFQPIVRGDPWLRLGAGYRWLWENDPTNATGISVVRHGFDLLTAKIGYDIRVSEDVALAPVIGADLTTFVWETPSNGTEHAMSSAEVATFVYAGLQGRFDIGGSRGGVQVAAAPKPVGVTAPQRESPIGPPPVQPVSPSIAVSEDVLRECNLSLDAIDKAPKFDFDESRLLPADLPVLNQIAACFVTGPLKDSGLHLVPRRSARHRLLQ